MKRRGSLFFVTIFLLLGLSLKAYANPSGENVVAGSATFDSSTPNLLTVTTTSNNTIINYNSFSIAANETTRINQPSSNSVTLNRVVGVNPSDIEGSLSSNGEIFLVNPNGVLFGNNASVNAPSLVVSTLDINNNDFLNGNYNFSNNSGNNSYIINHGTLTASPGGYIALLSQAIYNGNVIFADLGSVALASGEQMTMALDSHSQISVVIGSPVHGKVLGLDGIQIHNGIQNVGIIRSMGGKIALTAQVMNSVFDYAVNNSGVIEAGSIQSNNGVIELAAIGQSIINSGSIVGPTVNITVPDASFINTGMEFVNVGQGGNIKLILSTIGNYPTSYGIVVGGQINICVPSASSLINLGSIGTQSLNVSVATPLAVSYLTLTTSNGSESGNETAGDADQLTITAYDAFGAVATGYTGAKSIVFSGANPIGSYNPTVTDSWGTPVSFGSPETIVFSKGVSTGGSFTLYKAETAVINASDGTLTTNFLSLTVAPAAAASLALSANTTTMVAGTEAQLYITAYDLYGNVATGYSGNKNITFSGASSIGTYNPTVTDFTGTPNNIGNSESLTFTQGVSTAGGLMVLYQAGVTPISSTDGNLTSNTLNVTVNPSQAAILSIAPIASSLTAGVSDQIIITAYDTYGNVATGYSGNKNITFSGANSIGSYVPTVTNSAGVAVNFGTAEAISFSQGISTTGGLMTLYKAGTYSIKGSDGVNSANFTSVTVVSSAAASLIISPIASSLTAGSPVQLTITAYDIYGNVATGYTGGMNYTFSGASPIGSYQPTATDYTGTPNNFGNSETIYFTNGVNSAGGAMTLYLSGPASIKATDGVLTSNTVNVTVIPAVAASLSITPAAFTVSAGSNDQLTITAYDLYGNIATGYTGAKTITFSGAARSPSGSNPTVTNSIGNAQGFLLGTGITFTKGVSTVGGVMNLYDAQNTSITGTDGNISGNSLNITVNPAIAKSLALSAATSTLIAGNADQLTITAIDAYGNIATGYSGTKVLIFSGSNNSPNGTVPTATSNLPANINFGSSTNVNFSSGVGTSLVTLYLVGASQQISATNGIINTAAGHTAAVTVTQGAASYFVITGLSSNVAGTSSELTITADDAYGNVAKNYSGIEELIFSGASLSPNGTAPYAIDSGGAVIAYGAYTSVSFASGVGKANTNIYAVGVSKINVTAGIISATKHTLAMTINPSTTSNLSVTGSGSMIAGVSTVVTITAVDTYGNTVTTYAGAKTLIFSGADISPNGSAPTAVDSSTAKDVFGANTVLTFTKGVATSSVSLYTAETASVNVTDGTIASGANGLSVVVSPANASSLGVAGSTIISDGQSNALTITAFDPYGNTATGYTGNKSLIFSGASVSPNNNAPTATDNTGTSIPFGGSTAVSFSSGVGISTATLYTVETANINVTDGTISATSLPVTVLPSPATYLAVTGNSSMTSGSSNQLTITAYDSWGNTAKGYSGVIPLIFSGATPPGNGNVPTATDYTNTNIPFGNNTSLNFNGGVGSSTVVLYTPETAIINVTDGAINANGHTLNIAVTVLPKANLVLIPQQVTQAIQAGSISEQLIGLQDNYLSDQAVINLRSNSPVDLITATGADASLSI